jgi:hypothetical protein
MLSLALAPVLVAGAGEVIEVGKFSAEAEGDGPPADWKPLTFKKIPRHTVYKLVKEGKTVVIQADSDAASAGLTREIRIDPRDYPFVRWSWKATRVYKNGDVTRKDGDDYPARLYIAFEYDADRVGILDRAVYEAARLLYGQYPPLGALNYIWESRQPIGTIWPNPYTDRVRMIVVESGTGRLGTWKAEARNVLEDYRKAFGIEPPMISGVAILTDTDNTKESATTFYGDIVFSKRP